MASIVDIVSMFDSSLITYAVSLHFSQKVNEVVISTLQAIADKTGNLFMIENKIPLDDQEQKFWMEKNRRVRLAGW